MPEIKNTFTQGKMNKDLDERLLPNGQYRDALNVEVSTSEGSNVGTVKNVLGNHRLENIVANSFKCVGSIANEQTNKLYWFVSRYDVDAIIEYDLINDITTPVLVDANAGNHKAVLKFSGNIITGINIIDNLLFWTDNNSDPKKINIERCKKGTAQDSFTSSTYNHTQLIFENGSFNGITLNKVSNSATGNNFLTSAPTFGKYFWIAPIPFVKAIGNTDTNGADVTGGNFDYNYSISPGYVFKVRHYRDNKFLGIKEVRYFGLTTEEALIADPTITANNGTSARLDSGAGDNDWKVGDILFGNNITVDIEERHITVIKPKPLNALSVKINHSESTSTSNIPNLFETKLPRFSYRYKYRDGEYSAFAPFTAPVFNPKYPKDTGLSIDSNVFYNKDNAYDIKEPYNKAMVNSIHSVDLSDFIDAQTPEDVIEIDILYKQEESSIIYSIDTVKYSDSAWHLEPATQGASVGYNNDFNGDNYSTKGGLTKGRYLVTTENIYAALPSNQLLRPWDNVPRKALAQEITGNRIIYGNYVQSYDLVNEAKVSVSYSTRKNQIGSFASQGLPSIKSQRNYQLGVVYCDKFGRETPVFTSKTAAVNVPWQDSSGNKNASKSNQLNASVVADFPEWVDSLKFFVKETSNPYYNLTMDRAWVTKSTYDLDDSEGHLWLSFPSSDRNKISEEDYIILKKKIGAGEEQVNFENKYKVIDIKNEAPDAIKYRLVNMGVANNFHATQPNRFTDEDWTDTGSTTDALLYGSNAYNRIDKNKNDLIRIDAEHWITRNGVPRRSLLKPQTNGAVYGDQNHSDVLLDDLYISWRRTDTDKSESKKYKISGGWKSSRWIFMQLASPITKIDADIAHVNGNSADTNQNVLYSNLSLQIEQKELKDSEDFSGKFFVKISKNQVTDIIETGNIVDITKQYQVTSKASSFYWEDKIGLSASVDVGNYGNTNYQGFESGIGTGTSNIHNIVNNNVGDVSADSGNATSNGLLKVTDYHEPWEGIQIELNAHYLGPWAFFIDSMHMAAGQSDASDYAKYCCITWSGTTAGVDGDEEDSSWSYPPLKTWITDFGNTLNMITPAGQGYEKNTGGGFAAVAAAVTIPASSIWYENNLITTAPILSPNDNYEGLKIDGWVGPLQKVSRQVPSLVTTNHVNGLEGIVTTTAKHGTGPRRWLSGMTGSDHGVGSDTQTYSNKNEIGRHFMHLSFFAPGQDLHNALWDSNGGTLDSGGDGGEGAALYGPTSFAANLQGIWGGGVFTGKHPNEKFGVPTTGLEDDKFFHMPMEGNNDSSGNILPGTPGPGVGYGYDTSKNYRELHERQWDPTFNSSGDDGNKIRDFIRNLYSGSKFRFNRVNDTLGAEVYTIKSVQIKKLYNHTSWRKAYNRWVSGEHAGEEYMQGATSATLGPDHEEFQSVEELGLRYIDQLDETGVGTTATPLKNKIVQFGRAHNRRLCYIIELDKNFATEEGAYNPLDIGEGPDASGGIGNDVFCDIEFLDPVKDVLLSDLSKFPAIWELDPKKAKVDLDIYYEASGNIPVKLNEKTNELLAPIGCKVEVLNSSIGGTSIVESWDGAVAKLSPGLPKGDTIGNEINYTGMSFKFIREDGSYTIVEGGLQDMTGDGDGVKTIFNFREDIAGVISAGLDWYNCFTFGNGLESNRIKDDFNEVYIGNGAKASTTLQQAYKEERRKSGLIYSGIYNSNSGVNDLNQFIQAEPITKDLNPTYGSIQKLFQRRISLIAFCEDRVVGITSNKDTIFNADGNPQLIASNKVLGDASPFEGNYGISKNPESFASESYRAYFTDKQRGAVLRLSKDGLTPISSGGMKNWFRDNLPDYNTLLGTYDSYKEDYNITLLNNEFSENLVLDSYLETGIGLTDQVLGSLNKIENPGVHEAPIGSGKYLYELHTVDDNNINNPFTWTDGSSPLFTNDITNLKGHANVLHHAVIPAGHFQADNGGGTPATPIYGGDENEIMWASAIYNTWDGNGASVYPSGGGLPDDGWWYDPRFTSVTDDLFGAAATNLADAQVHSKISRSIELFGLVNEASTPGVENNNPLGSTAGGVAGGYNWVAGYDPYVEKAITYPIQSSGSYINKPINKVSACITRNSGAAQGTAGAITFDRCDPTGSYVEFANIGNSASYPPGAGVNDEYWNINPTGGQFTVHNQFFNGDELHVQFELTCFKTIDLTNPNNTEQRYGYNIIVPQLELWDAATGLQVDSSKLCGLNAIWLAHLQENQGAYNPYEWQQTSPGDLGGDFSANMVGAGNSYVADGGAYKCIYYGTRGSSTVTFPKTDGTNIPSLTEGSLPISGGNTETVLCGASFKFRDDAQQDSSGVWDGSGEGVEEAVVVQDLKIRIMNTHKGSDFQYDYSGSRWAVNGNVYGYPMARPLWEINKVLIKKGFGVVQPYTPYTEETDDLITDWLNDAVPAAVDIPLSQVDAWIQVGHDANHGFGSSISTSTNPSGQTGNEQYTQQQTTAIFGGNRSGTLTTASSANGNDTYTWLVPDAAPTGIFTPPASIDGSTTFTSGPWLAKQGNVGTPVTLSHNNSYISTKHSGGAGYSYPFIVDVSADPQVGDGTSTGGTWYLVDVEFDESHGCGDTVASNAAGGNAGQIGGNSAGCLAIHSAGPSDHINATVSWAFGDTIDPNGIGRQVGPNSTMVHLGLMPVTRTEYGGAPKLVLRAIFQYSDESYYTDPSFTQDFWNKFRIASRNLDDELRINKVIVKKLNQTSTWTDWLGGNGIINHWTSQAGSLAAPHYDPHHAFSKKRIYHYNGKLCWEVPAVNVNNNNAPHSIDIASQNTHQWEQTFAVPPVVSGDNDGWELSFTVTKNNKTGEDFTGALRGFVAIEDLNAPYDVSTGLGGFEGVYFKDIQEPGVYRIKFNFDSWNNGEALWSFQRKEVNDPDVNYADYTDGDFYGASALNAYWEHVNVSNRIHFSPGITGVNEFAVSSIKLTDTMPVFSGGSAGSWNFSGFNTSLYNYIFWDQLSENIVFNNCPTIDATTNELKFININQQIDKTISKNEQYEISFTHGIEGGSSAELSIYYYNAEGFGFKIEGINSATIGNTGAVDPNDLSLADPGAEPFKQTVTIGESEWSNINQENNTYNADLKNSFVIQVQGSENDSITGYIDNIAMVRVFAIGEHDDTTVSFSEGVNGWTSFKSFTPENGLSLSKKYFTFKNGALYQHYVPLRYETFTSDFGAVFGPLWLTEKDGHIWTAQEAGNYNRFYGNTLEADGAFSSITTVLNQQPSVVKMFNTINYEGSQTYVVKPQNASEVNINNAAAWKNNFDIKGWRCSEIKTDLDSGTVKEFIEKEGKWFNYIKGLNINPTIANTSLFSTQGIGIIPSGSVSDITEVDEFGEEIILGGVVNQGAGQGGGAGDFEYGGEGGGGGGGGGY